MSQPIKKVAKQPQAAPGIARAFPIAPGNGGQGAGRRDFYDGPGVIPLRPPGASTQGRKRMNIWRNGDNRG